AASYETQISDVPAGHVVELQGLNLGWPFSGGGDRLVVLGATTEVVLADSVVVGRSSTDLDTFSALRVEDAEVQVHRCTLMSWVSAAGSEDSGGAALTAVGAARVPVASSSIHGGPGATVYFGFGPTAGGPAICVAGAAGGTPFLWVADSTVLGGPGGAHMLFGNPQPGAGGPGILATSAHVRVSGDASSLVYGGYAGAAGMSVLGNYPGEVHSVTVEGGGLGGPATIGPVVLDLPPLPVLRAAGSFSLAADGTLTLSHG